MNETGILSGLRDIRLPPPPADLDGGWQALALIVLLGLVVLFALITLWRRRNAWRFEAARLIESGEAPDPGARLAEIAAVLRRVAILRGGTDVVRLSGDRWLQQLDRVFGGSYFSNGPGRVFGDNLYRPPSANLDTNRLGRGIARMLRRGAVWPW
jgi:hypothetical protein